MKEVTPVSSFALFVSNMKSLYNWDVMSSGDFDPEHPKPVPVFVIKKRSYATVARQRGTEDNG